MYILALETTGPVGSCAIIQEDGQVTMEVSSAEMNHLKDLLPMVGRLLSAAGLAKSGMRPLVAIYSSFLQRAYDQLVEDICLQNLPVVFLVDRAGCVGADGETHHGVFDLSYLSHIPGMTVLTPKDGNQLQAMMEYAV